MLVAPSDLLIAMLPLVLATVIIRQVSCASDKKIMARALKKYQECSKMGISVILKCSYLDICEPVSTFVVH